MTLTTPNIIPKKTKYFIFHPIFNFGAKIQKKIVIAKFYSKFLMLFNIFEIFIDKKKV
jgi:hypothetical protein